MRRRAGADGEGTRSPDNPASAYAPEEKSRRPKGELITHRSSCCCEPENRAAIAAVYAHIAPLLCKAGSDPNKAPVVGPRKQTAKFVASPSLCVVAVRPRER